MPKNQAGNSVMGILIVDDDDDTRKIFQALIANDYKDVRTAESAAQAFSLLDLGANDCLEADPKLS